MAPACSERVVPLPDETSLPVPQSWLVAHWPDQRWQGWLMLGVVLLALAPLLLLILDRVAHTGGSVEFRGIKIAFAAEAAESEITLPR